MKFGYTIVYLASVANLRACEGSLIALCSPMGG